MDNVYNTAQQEHFIAIKIKIVNLAIHLVQIVVQVLLMLIVHYAQQEKYYLKDNAQIHAHKIIIMIILIIHVKDVTQNVKIVMDLMILNVVIAMMEKF